MLRWMLRKFNIEFEGFFTQILCYCINNTKMEKEISKINEGATKNGHYRIHNFNH